MKDKPKGIYRESALPEPQIARRELEKKVEPLPDVSDHDLGDEDRSQ